MKLIATATILLIAVVWSHKLEKQPKTALAIEHSKKKWQHKVRQAQAPANKNFVIFETPGFCSGADNHDSYARRFEMYGCPSALADCATDPLCVAFSCIDTYNQSVLYTGTNCTLDCDDTEWLNDPSLITNTTTRTAQPMWNTAECHVVEFWNS